MKLVVGISGASGAPYARRLLRHVAALPDVETHLVLSRTAEQVYRHECGQSPTALGLPTFGGRDYGAPCASGSARFDAMVVIPASMSCVARIAHGISDDLLTRAADVMLKERRRLVLVPREAPYSAVHLENMLAATRAGALLLPASPAFYGHPQSIDDLLDGVVGRVLDHLGVDNTLSRRWGSDVVLAADADDADDSTGGGPTRTGAPPGIAKTAEVG